MQKMALLVLLFAVAAGVVVVVVKVATSARQHLNGPLKESGNGMQRLAFFLLLALIAYVAAIGAA